MEATSKRPIGARTKLSSAEEEIRPGTVGAGPDRGRAKRQISIALVSQVANPSKKIKVLKVKLPRPAQVALPSAAGNSGTSRDKYSGNASHTPKPPMAQPVPTVYLSDANSESELSDSVFEHPLTNAQAPSHNQ